VLGEGLVQVVGGEVVGTYAFVNPLIAVLLGWWLLGEHVGTTTLLATTIMVTGVALIVFHPTKPPRPRTLARHRTGRHMRPRTRTEENGRCRRNRIGVLLDEAPEGEECRPLEFK
jgi:hypothetical protein